jgi:hypothetical protein
VTLALPPLHLKYRKKSGYPIGEDEHWYFVSGKTVFYVRDGDYCALVGADPNTFELLDPPIARDAKRVWVWGDEIKGANGASFAWIDQPNTRWTDGRNTYDTDTKLDPSASSETVVGIGGVAGHDLTLTRNGYYLDGVLIDGWTPETHRAGPLGFIEAESYLYSHSSLEGGSVLVWTKSYNDVPLAAYIHDTSLDCWRLSEPVPPASMLLTMPIGPLITREEFNTILECWPDEDQHADWSLRFETPTIDVVIWPIARSISVKGDVECSFIQPSGDRPTESVYPARTPGVCAAIRSAVDLILSECPPLSFKTLEELIARIPKEHSSYSFASDNPAMIEGRFNIIIQDGSHGQRGVWIDTLRGGVILRMAVSVEDNGFLSPACFSGPISLWEQVDDEGFEPAAFSAERRGIWRAIVDEVVRDAPVQRAATRKGATRAKTKEPWAEPSVWRDALVGLLALLAPSLVKSKAKQIAKALSRAADAGEQDGAWEALMDALESQGLLQTFDKQELLEAVERCVDFASAAGIKGRYALSGHAPAKSFYDIAEDFERWLQPQGFCLLWPSGTFRSSGDDHFPAVIVRVSHTDQIIEVAEALGDGRGFTQTLTGSR